MILFIGIKECSLSLQARESSDRMHRIYEFVARDRDILDYLETCPSRCAVLSRMPEAFDEHGVK